MSGALWLDMWTKNIVADALDIDRRGPLGRYDLEKYRLLMLNRTLRDAQLKSSFYQERLLGVDLKGGNVPKTEEELREMGVSLISLSSVSELSRLPFTTASDLDNAEYTICCMKPDGSTHLTALGEKGRFGAASRKVVFTNRELSAGEDFFYNGLKSLISEDERVLILLPSRRPGSAGDLIRRAVEHIGAESVPYGPLNDEVLDWGIYLDLLNLEKISCIIGPASQIANLAQVAAGRAGDRRYSDLISEVNSRIKSVVLGGEISAQRNYDAIKEAWNCNVYEFYGRTESGMGAAISCGVGTGLHLRESGLYVEIINPESGEVLPEGEEGEIVVTTLSRTAMPLIRYRTGDISRILKGSCPCGSELKRIAPLRKK